MEFLAAAEAFLNFTIGNVVTIVSCLGAGFAAWQKLSDKLEQQEDRMARVEKDLDDLAAKGLPTLCALHADRLSAIERQVAVIGTVATDVTWIKHELQRVSRRVEKGQE